MRSHSIITIIPTQETSNTSKEKYGGQIETFAAAFGRVEVSNELVVLAQLSTCFAWVLLCILTLYFIAKIATNLDGKLFIEKQPIIVIPVVEKKNLKVEELASHFKEE